MDEVQEKLAELNSLLKATLPYELGVFDPAELDLLDVNARFMRNDTFAQLVANVKKDKGLSSVPLVYAGDPEVKPKVISGNHRVKAALVAKLPRIFCLVIREKKTPQELVAIQLSHNALAGEDDLQILKKLYDQVSALDLKAYSGLDEDIIKQLSSIKFEPISEPRLRFKSVSFLFLPAEIEEIKALASETDKILKDEDTYLFQLREYAEFFQIVARAKEQLNIKNSSVAVLELMRVGMRRLEQEQEEKQAVSA